LFSVLSTHDMPHVICEGQENGRLAQSGIKIALPKSFTSSKKGNYV